MLSQALFSFYGSKPSCRRPVWQRETEFKGRAGQEAQRELELGKGEGRRAKGRERRDKREERREEEKGAGGARVQTLGLRLP